MGVGGYLLGNGVNVAGSATKHGLGGENVVEYRMVDAEGDLLVVDKGRVRRSTMDGQKVRENMKRRGKCHKWHFFGQLRRCQKMIIIIHILIERHQHLDMKLRTA